MEQWINALCDQNLYNSHPSYLGFVARPQPSGVSEYSTFGGTSA